MRLIDADALKKDIARLHVLNDEAEIRRAYEYNPHVTSTDFEETLVSVFDAIDDAPSIGIPTWIPCSERLPSESGRYLCTYAEIQRGEYISGIDFGSFINGEWYTSGVIAWMPLPDPYGEREGE